MIMFYAYVLQSESNQTFYYGSTENLENRLLTHNAGLVNYTSKYLPWKIVYFESFSTRSEAMKREKFFKTGAGRDFIKRQLAM
jgi:putative endonuclease